MKKTLLSLLLSLMILMPVLAGAEVLTLPLDFTPGMRPQGSYPPKYGEQGYSSYQDPSITASYERVRRDDWHITCYLVRIKISNGSQIRTAAATSFDQKGLAPTETIAKRYNAIAAANGDYYSGNAGRYVLRQGKVFRDSMAENQDILLIDEDGDFHIILAGEHPENMDKTTIGGKRVNNALCFGPALIRDGEIVADPAKAQPASNPLSGETRIAICQTGPLEYMLITVAYSGMTLEDFTNFLYSLGGIQQAYNLDGGNSCHLVFMGNWMNRTETNGGKDYRNVPDIVYFASAWKPD